MAEDKPLISIIMPAFNAGDFIDRAIHSVLKQTYSNWELLVVNDGSVDDTAHLVGSFNDKRIIYYEQPNQGVSVSRNIGLEAMEGDFFCFLDADDILPPNSLQDRLTIFLANPEVVFVDGLVEVFDNTSGGVQRLFTPSFEGNPFYDLLTLSGRCFMGITWMIRWKPGETYRFKENLTHAEDLLFFMSLSNGGKYTYARSIVYKCRTGHNSAMNNLNKLEKGYFAVHRLISEWPQVSQKEALVFKKKIKSIMFKSYLGNGNYLDAAKVLLQ